MIIQTILNIGDIAWFIKDNKVVSQKVIGLNIHLDSIFTNAVCIRYYFKKHNSSIFDNVKDKHFSLLEEQVFISKQDLIDSL